MKEVTHMEVATGMRKKRGWQWDAHREELRASVRMRVKLAEVMDLFIRRADLRCLPLLNGSASR